MRHTAAALLALAACQPATTRPAFGPLPAAPDVAVDLDVPTATRLLAEALKSDSIPVSRVEARDGYLETGWFDARTGLPSEARPLGDSLVRVRGWVNAYGEERASLRVESAVRPLANPALPPRQLDQQAPDSNPAAVRVARVLEAMGRRYPVPGAEPPPAPSKALPVGATPDSAAAAPRDSAPAPAGQEIEKKRPVLPPSKTN